MHNPAARFLFIYFYLKEKGRCKKNSAQTYYCKIKRDISKTWLIDQKLSVSLIGFSSVSYD